MKWKMVCGVEACVRGVCGGLASEMERYVWFALERHLICCHVDSFFKELLVEWP